MSPSAEPASPPAEVASHLVPANLLSDGEIVIFAVKPSNWYVLIVSLPVLISVSAVAAGAYVLNRHQPQTPEHAIYFCAAAAGMARLTLACWQWLGRTYVLTSRRVVCVRGLLKVAVASAPLAEVSAAVLLPSLFERPIGVASIYCFTGGESDPARLSPGEAAVAWHTVVDPGKVQDILNDAISRAHRANHREG